MHDSALAANFSRGLMSNHSTNLHTYMYLARAMIEAVAPRKRKEHLRENITTRYEIDLKDRMEESVLDLKALSGYSHDCNSLALRSYLTAALST